MSQPDDDIRDIDNTAFGVTTLFGMKEIVGYAMIEPDGSVMAKVPANAALMVSIVDENGMRITQRHQNWISAAGGQELKCNGCHDANSGVSHGRMMRSTVLMLVRRRRLFSFRVRIRSGLLASRRDDGRDSRTHYLRRRIVRRSSRR